MIRRPASAPAETGSTLQRTAPAGEEVHVTGTHLETSPSPSPSPPNGTASPGFPSASGLSWADSLDHCLLAIVSLDVPRDTVHIDIGGSLTGVSRDDLFGITGRIRQLRPGSHIHVHLGPAMFVESAALAGLRTDLETLDGVRGGQPGQSGPSVQGRGVSLETRSLGSAQEWQQGLAGITSCPARLDGLTDDELLSASDFVFTWLDDEDGCPGTDVAEMLALYELIGQEMSGRTGPPPA